MEIADIIYDSRIPDKYLRAGISIYEYDGLESVIISQDRIISTMIRERVFQSLDEIYNFLPILDQIKIVTASMRKILDAKQKEQLELEKRLAMQDNLQKSKCQTGLSFSQVATGLKK